MASPLPQNLSQTVVVCILTQLSYCSQEYMLQNEQLPIYLPYNLEGQIPDPVETYVSSVECESNIPGFFVELEMQVRSCMIRI